MVATLLSLLSLTRLRTSVQFAVAVAGSSTEISDVPLHTRGCGAESDDDTSRLEEVLLDLGEPLVDIELDEQSDGEEPYQTRAMPQIPPQRPTTPLLAAAAVAN